MGTSPTNRWRPRFSLRALLLLITVLCLLLGYHVPRARQQRFAVAALLEAGAVVVYDWGGSKGRQQAMTFQSAAPAPAWLRKLIGDEYFQEVFMVEWSIHSPVRTGAFADLAELPELKMLVITGAGNPPLDTLPSMINLEHLSIKGCQITDTTLQQIGRQWSLNDLTLEITGPVTAQGMECLAEPQRLRTLDLSHSAIGDELLPAIGRLPALQSLTLDFTDITDAGVAHLHSIRALSKFSAVGGGTNSGARRAAKVSLGDMALQTLAGHSRLTRLEIGRRMSRSNPSPRITSSGLAALVRLPLTELGLHNAALTDSDIAALKSMRSLNEVKVSGASFSPDGVQQLKISCPHTSFHFD